MVVDAECGMPLDLGKWESIWDGTLDDSALNPNPTNTPILDPEDEYLLAELPSSFVNGHSTPGGVASVTTPVSTPFVPWLRKTEYISSRDGAHRATHEIKQADTAVDVSREAQIRDIELTFAAQSEGNDISTLRHPSKPHLRAVESYEILPDPDIWANAYDLFRFAERPGERPPEQSDLRLDSAILRPMESDGDHFLAYYLTKEDEDADAFKTRRMDPFTEIDASQPAVFHFVRDYETVKIEQDVEKEFLLVLDDGDSDSRLKGAYYNIERKMTLKKRRINTRENVSYTDKWDVINLTHILFSTEEEEERQEAASQVIDPTYPARVAEERAAMADGEGEIDPTANARVDGGDPLDPDDDL
jgi:RNA polymerase II-associated factor 1